jgi:hypothetical protein
MLAGFKLHEFIEEAGGFDAANEIIKEIAEEERKVREGTEEES